MPQIGRTTGAGQQPAPSDDALLAAAKEYTLPSGRVIFWLPPDEMEMLAFTGELPDSLTAAIYLLLEEEGAIVKEDDPASYQRKRSQERAKDAIVKAGMIKPKYDPDLALGDGINVIGRRQLARGDRNYIYNWLFRVGTTPEAFAVAANDQPGGLADAGSDRNGLRPEPGGADQAGDQSDRSGAGVLPESGGALVEAAEARERAG